MQSRAKTQPEFRPTWLARALGFARWEIRLEEFGLTLSQVTNGTPGEIAFRDIAQLYLARKLFWTDLVLEYQGRQTSLPAMGNQEAEALAGQIRSGVGGVLIAQLQAHQPALAAIHKSLDNQLAVPRYVSHRDLQTWRTSLGAEQSDGVSTVAGILNHALLPKTRDGIDPYRIDRILDVLTGTGVGIKKRNDAYVASEMATYSALFDAIESTPLTQEQRIAAVVLEDRNRLIAAAGSGKTSTLVGKVGYVLASGQYRPEECLVLAFNRSAAVELDGRLNTRLKSWIPEGQKLRASTFHALGYDIIGQAGGAKPSVANWALGGDQADKQLIQDLVARCSKSDHAFLADWSFFRSVCLKPARDPVEFKSIAEWNDYVKAVGDYRDGANGFITIAGEMVKSQGELAIANWLYLQGVPYEYEKAYEIETADARRRQYRPDFYFSEIDAYLEHYAIGPDGNPAGIFGEQYAESIRWKDALHATHKTRLLVTTFADFIDGSLFDKLKVSLTACGQVLRPRDVREVINTLNQTQRANYISLFKSFLQLAKSNELGAEDLRQKSLKPGRKFRERLFLRIMAKLVVAYEAKLQEAGEIDFDDMIVAARRHIETGRYKHPYRLILIDEAQDLSRSRGKLIKALLDQRPDCKLFAVGDDWQSIYRFAGSDIDLFTNFAQHFGATATHQLTKTFRSNQRIATAASEFVQRNPAQLKKAITAVDAGLPDAIQIREFIRFDDLDALVEKTLAELAAAPGPKIKTVFILGRYREREPANLAALRRRFPHFDLSYRTIHASKGLTADAVIITGLNGGAMSFPSEIVDDPLLGLVMPAPEAFRHAEERRLFYVAMTRARHRVYLLASRMNSSGFVREIMPHTPKFSGRAPKSEHRKTRYISFTGSG